MQYKNVTILIEQAAISLDVGQLVAFPTETVYGLGADAENDEAVAAIFQAKGRPPTNPLIVHVATQDMAERYGIFNEPANTLANAFWPGPLTLVVPRKENAPLSPRISPNAPTVALRVPAHPVAQQLLKAFGRGIAAPSANRSGRVSPTTARHVAEEFAGQPDAIAMILDGGPTQVGIESTVIDCTNDQPVIIRPGSITQHDIVEIAPDIIIENSIFQPAISPGLMESHYAPRLPVRLNAADVLPGEALLAFGIPIEASQARRVMNLSAAGNLEEAATNLYAHLRALDMPEFTAIAVMPIPKSGIGIAINDRLRRAAAKR